MERAVSRALAATSNAHSKRSSSRQDTASTLPTVTSEASGRRWSDFRDYCMGAAGAAAATWARWPVDLVYSLFQFNSPSSRVPTAWVTLAPILAYLFLVPPIAIAGRAPPGLVRRAVAALNDARRSRAFPLLVGFTLMTSGFWISGPSDATSKASVSDIIGQGVTNVLDVTPIQRGCYVPGNADGVFWKC